MADRRIDYEYLILSWQDESPDSNYYLDTETGNVELVKRDLLDVDDLRDEIEKNHERYLYVPKPDRKDGPKDVKAFLDTVCDQSLARILEMAFEAPDPLHACRTILSKHPQELERWENFRTSRIRERINEWLAANFIITDNS